MFNIMRFFDRLFGNSPRLPQQFWDDLINANLVIVSGQVLCRDCHAVCKDTERRLVQGRLQVQYNDWLYEKSVSM